MRNLSFVFFLVAAIPFVGYSQTVRETKFKELSVDSTREFTVTKGSTSIARKMNLFEMPQEYQCPLFSDSPYVDVLGAIDGMQSQLNTVFPECENKSNNDLVSAKAGELRSQIFEAQKLQESGQSYKLNLTTNSIIQKTQQLQQLLSNIAQSQTKVCYRSNQQFRNVIFSINETFQSLAPIVLDFVKNNPALAQTMGPTIKVLTGAENISKGISLIEQIAKDSVMFDMTDSENRINTIKNTCQFMKLYRRVQYLRLSKLGQVQTIHNDFQNKIALMNQNLQNIKNQAGVQFQALTFQSLRLESSNLTDTKSILSGALSKSIPVEIDRVQKALSDIESANEQYNKPLIPQCQTILSIRSRQTLKTVLADIDKFSNLYEDSFDIQRLSSGMQSYDNEIATIDTTKDKLSCIQFGQDWLKMANQVLFEGRKLVLKYQASMSDMNGDQFTIEQKRISQKEKQIQSEKSNYESLKTLINIAAFESAELEKKFGNMHRYLFKGPDFNEIQASCDSTDKNANCTPGKLKAAYQWYRNDGPVYELFKNDKQYFDLEFDKVVNAISTILTFEQKKTLKYFNGKVPSQQNEFDAYLTKAYEFSHLSTKHLVKNTSEYVQICRQSNIALNSYLKATGYLASSESLCNMIYPVLDAETNISSALLGYCQPMNGNVSQIQKQIIRLVGYGPAKKSTTDVYRNNFKYSVKTIVDKLIQKYDDLGCEQKSGIY
jgi:hypothetical protein